MPLVQCPACGREISTEAEACPQCGHPNYPTRRLPAGPNCYACSAEATTKCQSCGIFSCARHLESIYVPYGNGGAYELRCESCHSQAVAWKVLVWVLGGIALLVFLAFLLLMRH
jgi:hypothetical protein